MEPLGNRYFDPICPDIPVLHATDQEICAELTAKLTSQSIGTNAFSAQKIASMIVGSQHLRRLAVKYSDDINSILNCHGAAVMARAEQEFLSEMSAHRMTSTPCWPYVDGGRSCLIAAL